MFWKLIKNIRSGQKTTTKGIKNENGEIETDEREILNVWRRYFENLLNCGAEKFVNDKIIPNIEENPESISIVEVEISIKKLQFGKAAGVDEIRPEMIKCGGIVVMQWLHYIRMCVDELRHRRFSN